jgi:hypothetical protein
MIKPSVSLGVLAKEIDEALVTCDQLGAGLIACHLQRARDLVAQASACLSGAAIGPDSSPPSSQS